MPTEKARKAAIALTQVGHGLVEGEPVNVGSLGWVKAAYGIVRQVADEAEQFPDGPLIGSKHPYYSSESNFYSNEYPYRFGSWKKFRESGWYDSDEDMNYLVRWDWKTPDPDDYEATGVPLPDHDTLHLFFVLQRKGIYAPVEVAVKSEDEPDVKAWLKTRWRTVQANWSPIR